MNDVRNTIGWATYSWNPVTGCTRNCFYCYVKGLNKRFGYSQDPTFHEKRLLEPENAAKGSKIFVCSTGDLFGDGSLNEWVDQVLSVVNKYPNLTFQFLTKNPTRYDYFEFPKNAWLGTTITGKEQNQGHLYARIAAKNKNIRFISFEPLMGMPEPIVKRWVDWIIIGAMTGPDRAMYKPKQEWIKGLLIQADKLKIPVYMKSNLKDAWSGRMRQEFPK